MATGVLRKFLFLFVLTMLCTGVFAQDKVSLGIHYQAVARDNFGSELVNKKISVKFSIISEDPLSAPVYQELHQDVTTSKFGVFSIVIGHGVPTGNSPFSSLSDVAWGRYNHYLKVEVKFENDFMDMGTMQFLAVPYALYSQKSLEPGPAGPKGDQGDPATDDQSLSFDGSTLSISGGNSVPLNNLIQNLSVVPGADGKYLSISGGNSVNIATAESDGDPNNEIQDLILNASNNSVTLSKSSAPAISLNDADADPQNEIQAISYNTDNHQLALSNGGGSAMIDPLIAFRVGIQSNITLPDNVEVPIVFDLSTGNYYIDGANYNQLTGKFTPLYNGIYTFNVSLNLPTSASVIIKVAGRDDERIVSSFSSTGFYNGSLTLKLTPLNIVNVVVKQNNGYPIPFNFSGYFSGFRLY